MGEKFVQDRSNHPHPGPTPTHTPSFTPNTPSSLMARLSSLIAVLGLAVFAHSTTASTTCDDLEEELRVCRLQEEEPPSTPSPSTGLDFVCDGILRGDVCCAAECGVCGNAGCSDRGFGLTGDDCCMDNIEDHGTLCSVAGKAPCLVDDVGGWWSVSPCSDPLVCTSHELELLLCTAHYSAVPANIRK